MILHDTHCFTFFDSKALTYRTIEELARVDVETDQFEIKKMFYLELAREQYITGEL